MEKLAEVIYQLVLNPSLAAQGMQDLQFLMETLQLSQLEMDAVYALILQGTDLLQSLQTIPGAHVLSAGVVDWACSNPAECITLEAAQLVQDALMW